ncbi:hypothetical protein J2741_002472 [Methanolinea mesophila]|uniref:hypothetical protein n=1 Tax=Methanolinea mesophila TaxID=547055 RepID=UPI001AE38B6F|nr:hypothetical protein [Methanolinea mesophila]MBP1929876.1 hypothetical protein [Methanolinea mesophila]
MQSIGKAFILFTAVILLVTVAQAAPFGLPAGSIHSSLESRLHTGTSFSAPPVSLSDSVLGRYGIGDGIPTAPSAPSTSLQGAYAQYPGDSQGIATGALSPGISPTAESIMIQAGGGLDPVVILQLSSGGKVGFGSGGFIGYWSS